MRFSLDVLLIGAFGPNLGGFRPLLLLLFAGGAHLDPGCRFLGVYYVDKYAFLLDSLSGLLNSDWLLYLRGLLLDLNPGDCDRRHEAAHRRCYPIFLPSVARPDH